MDLTVIIPMYNNDKYVKKSIDSIMEEFPEKAELIIINDASTDNSYEKALELSKKYKQIKIINNKKNIGCALSIQKGIKKAKGKYIGINSSDDFVDKGYYKKLLKIAIDKNADIVSANIAMYNENDDSIVKNDIYQNNFYDDKPINIIKKVNPLFLLSHWTASSASIKIIKKQILKKYPFIGSKANDIPSIYTAVANSNDVYYIPNLYKYYRYVPNSLSRRNELEEHLSVIDSMVSAFKMLRKTKQEEAIKTLFFNNYIAYLFDTIFSLEDEETRYMLINDYYEKTKKFDENIFEKMKQSKMYSKYSDKVEYNMFTSGKIIDLNKYLSDRKRGVSMKKTPLVSIVIPVYNGANYIQEAIDSALNQTYKNIEVLVVNDGSKDNTEELIKTYKDKVKYIYKENGGVASALNVAIDNMKGEYFSWLSHDDLYCPDKIEKQVNAIDNPNQIIACNITTINANGEKIQDFFIPERFKKSVKAFLAGSWDIGLNGCALLIPKEAFKKAGKFNEKLRYTQDYDMWFRMAENNFEFKLIDDNLVLSRQHENQDSQKLNNLCTIDSDVLHKDFLLKVDNEEFISAFDCNIEKLEEMITVYYCNKYTKTAACVIKHLIEYLMKNNKIKDAKRILNKYVLKLDSDNSIILPNYKNNNKILFYSNAWVRGGIERVLSIILNGLTKDYELYLLTPLTITKDAYELSNDISHITFGKEAEDNLTFTILCINLIYNIKIFVGNPNIIEKVLDIYYLLKEVNIKTLAINHYFYFLPYNYEWTYPIINKREEKLKDVDAVAWLTKFNYQIYSAYNQNGIILPNPCQFPIIKHDFNEENIILCVGRFYDDIKRIDRMFLTFKEVLKEKSDAKLWLVGDYDLEAHLPSLKGKTLKEFIESLDIPKESYKFCGEQKDNILDYYKKASLLLMTSESEGFPLAVLESITCGLPIVIGKITGLDELVENNVNGYVHNQDDYKSMAKSILNILNDKKMAKSLSEESNKKAEKYTKEEVLKKYKELFDSILNGNIKEEISKHYHENNEKVDMNIIIQEYEKHVKLLLKNNQEKTLKIQQVEENLSNLLLHINNQDKIINELTSKCNLYEKQLKISKIIYKPFIFLKKVFRKIKQVTKIVVRKAKTFIILIFKNPKRLIKRIKEILK